MHTVHLSKQSISYWSISAGSLTPRKFNIFVLGPPHFFRGNIQLNYFTGKSPHTTSTAYFKQKRDILTKKVLCSVHYSVTFPYDMHNIGF
jgi:hypothetical protein